LTFGIAEVGVLRVWRGISLRDPWPVPPKSASAELTSAIAKFIAYRF
jgi:hypothetical protein